MLVHEPSGGRERVEAVDADGIVHGRRVGEGEADPLPDLVDLVQVAPLPERTPGRRSEC